MSPEALLLVNFLTASLLLLAGISRRVTGRLSNGVVALAVFPLVNAVLLTAYVFGEDSYRQNGISRWDAYRSPGGALGPMLVLSLALMGACAALLLYAALRRKPQLLRVVAWSGAFACLALITPTILGFSLN
jgi:hypothetical protein